MHANWVFWTLLSRACFQVMSPVGENAVSGQQNRAGLGSPQREHKAADARVGAAAEQVGQLHPCGQRAVQVLHEVPDGHVDVGAVANHQGVDGHPAEAVVSWPAELQPWWVSVPAGAALEVWLHLCRHTVLLQHLPEEDFEELLKSQPHLKIKQQEVAYLKYPHKHHWISHTPISWMILQWRLGRFLFIFLHSS